MCNICKMNLEFQGQLPLWIEYALEGKSSPSEEDGLHSLKEHISKHGIRKRRPNNVGGGMAPVEEEDIGPNNKSTLNSAEDLLKKSLVGDARELDQKVNNSVGSRIQCLAEKLVTAGWLRIFDPDSRRTPTTGKGNDDDGKDDNGKQGKEQLQEPVRRFAKTYQVSPGGVAFPRPVRVQFCFDLFLNLDPYLADRSELVEEIIEQFQSADPTQNFCLVGRSGSGKDGLIYLIARRLAVRKTKDEDQRLSVCFPFIFNTIGVVAGTRWAGDWELRLEDLWEIFAKRYKQGLKDLIYIPEFHQITKVGEAEGRQELGQHLLRLVGGVGARPYPRFIGSTTRDEYDTMIDTARGLERRFLPIFLPDKLSEIEIRRILQHQAARNRVWLDTQTADFLVRSASLFPSLVPGDFASPAKERHLLEKVVQHKSEKDKTEEGRHSSSRDAFLQVIPLDVARYIVAEATTLASGQCPQAELDRHALHLIERIGGPSMTVSKKALLEFWQPSCS